MTNGHAGNYDMDRQPDSITFTLKSVFFVTRSYRIPQKINDIPELKPEHHYYGVITTEQVKDQSQMDSYKEAFASFGIPIDFQADKFHWRVGLLH
jgi:hypothetical protein